MTTFEMIVPEEPPIGSVVIDQRGIIWERINTDKWRNGGSFWSWEALLKFAPLKLKEPEPEEGTLRVHKMNPNWFIIFLAGKWVEYHIYSNHKWAKCDTHVNTEDFE